MRGYRINYPEEPIAWKALKFEYEELYNEHILDDLSDFLGIKGSWSTILSAFRERYGDAKGIWLTRKKEEVFEYDGRFGEYCLIYEYDPKLIISDLGPDGFFVLNARFIKEEEL
ncbi:MAG: hypothetical protein JRE40_13705 [Deltaproteobacteria bacterium]|nr:hypothetical protein [Deltaproteobacteria bacterium]